MKKYTLKNKAGIEVVSLEKLTNRSMAQIAEPHRIGFYQVYHFQTGSQGMLEINFDQIPVQPQTILFVPNDVVCAFQSDSHYTGKVIVFSELFAHKYTHRAHTILGSRLFNKFLPPEPVATQEPLIPLFYRLIEEELAGDPNQHQQVLLLNYLENLALLTERAKGYPDENPKLDKQKKVVHTFYQLLNQHYRQHKHLDFYCREMGITPWGLNKALLAHTGWNAKKLINQKVILEAKVLLHYSDLHVKEIGYQIGVKEPSYFALFFKRQVGFTPSEYRLQLAQRNVSDFL